jgi:flagellar protein FlaF
MYQFAYDEILEDSVAEARDREAAVFLEANRLLEAAIAAGANTPAAVQALRYNEELWMILVEDLANPGNLLPDKVRGTLISIGFWVIKEIERIRRGQSSGFQAIADINDTIRGGLN